MGAIYLYGKNVKKFQTTSLKPLGQWCSNFMWSLLAARERKNAKMVAVHWPRGPPCPYMVKTFKNLILKNRGCFGAESLRKLLGTGGLPKLLKWWSYIDVWPFYGEVKFASIYICMGPIHLCGKKVDNSIWLLLWSLWLVLLKFHVKSPWDRGMKDLLKWLWSIDQDGCHAHIW